MPTRSAALRLLAGLLVFTATTAAHAAPDPARLKRGQILFIANCSMCHQVTGRGTAGVYPPLAGSDFFAANREKAIRAVVEGLKGRINVNGRTYDGQMPPAVLDDRGVADVLTYVGASWGNSAPEFTPEEVARVRSQSAFKTYEDLVKANAYPPSRKPRPASR